MTLDEQLQEMLWGIGTGFMVLGLWVVLIVYLLRISTHNLLVKQPRSIRHNPAYFLTLLGFAVGRPEPPNCILLNHRKVLSAPLLLVFDPGRCPAARILSATHLVTLH